MRDDYYIDENGYYRYGDTGRLVSRHIAEKYVAGRRLRRGEVVHHINRNKLDNRPENLEVMTWEEHSDLHKSEWGYYSSDCSIWTLIKIILFIVTFPISLIVIVIWWWMKR